MTDKPTDSTTGAERQLDLSRRQLLRSAALALTALGTGLDAQTARQVHAYAQQVRGNGPRLFSANEWATLRRLTELIIPADEHSGSALDAGAPEFIDLLASESEELERIFTSGLLWLDNWTRRELGATFVELEETQQHEALKRLAESVDEPEHGYLSYESYEPSQEYQSFQDYGNRPADPLAAGGRFFGWLRRMTVDAFYTSRIGMDDVGFMGNTSSTEYSVPQESIDHALERSPFKSDD